MKKYKCFSSIEIDLIKSKLNLENTGECSGVCQFENSFVVLVDLVNAVNFNSDFLGHSVPLYLSENLEEDWINYYTEKQELEKSGELLKYNEIAWIPHADFIELVAIKNKKTLDDMSFLLDYVTGEFDAVIAKIDDFYYENRDIVQKYRSEIEV